MPPAAVQTAEWGVQSTWHWRGWPCHWRVSGPVTGPALLLLHGFGAASGHWRHCAPRLADQGWRVYSLDLLGFGQSAQPAQPMDNRLWALQVCAFLDQVVQGPAVVIGNSLGGLTALTAAVLEPAKVRAVIAASSAAGVSLNPSLCGHSTGTGVPSANNTISGYDTQ